MGSNRVKVTKDEVHLWERVTSIMVHLWERVFSAFIPGCHSQEQHLIRADVPRVVQCRVTDAIPSAGTRATLYPWAGRAEAPSTEVLAAERSGLGAGEQPPRAPRDAFPVPRAKGGSGRRQETFPRARGPCCDFAGRSAATQQEIVLPRLGGRAGAAEPRRAVPGPLPAAGPPSRLGGSRGTRATTALHGRGTGAREQPRAPGWKMQGRSPQPSMELNSECVAKRGD